MERKRHRLSVRFLHKVSIFLTSLRYRFIVKGLEDIPQQSADDPRAILFLSAHPGFSDSIIFMRLTWAKFHPRPLSALSQMQRPIMKMLVGPYNPVVLPDIKAHGREALKSIKEAIEITGKALQDGGNILIHPAGRFPRNGYENLGKNSMVPKVLKISPNTRIVLVRYVGLWGSRAGREPWNDVPPFGKILLQGLIAFFANLIIFIPKRTVNVTFEEAKDFPINGTREEINHYLENFYNAEYQPAVRVPLFWWQKTEILPNIQPPTHEH